MGKPTPKNNSDFVDARNSLHLIVSFADFCRLLLVGRTLSRKHAAAAIAT
jgi:hypothetical protein